MENSNKKVLKKTTSAQFDVLVKELEKNPDLARGAPMFGASKSLVEQQWSELAQKINSHGPPQRSAVEWKKIWADLKSRTKRKIAENASNLHATGGGPFQNSPLSEIEQAIDRILLMSKAAAPSGAVLGVRQVRSEQAIIDIASSPPPALPSQLEQHTIASPNRTATNIGVVTPTRKQPTIRSNPAAPAPQISRKRTFQEMIGESANEQAAAAKVQAEAAKQMAKAAMIQAEATKAIAETLKELLAISTRQMEAIEKIENKL